jgi:hypothetical protein
MLDALNRRALLEGLAAAGTLAFVRPARAAPGDTDPSPPPLEGTLAAWLIVHPGRGTDLRLAHFAPDGRLAGRGDPVWIPAPGEHSASAWGQVQSATPAAQNLSIAAAARSWRVPAADCRVEPGRIVHLGTRRTIAYHAWVDVA